MNFTDQAHIARLMTFAQHGQPSGYAASDMMRADLEALILTAAKASPAAIDQIQTAAYAEGRTDESKEMAGPLALLRDAFDLLESHLGDSEVEYVDEEEEREYAPVQVAARYLMAAIQAMRGDQSAVKRATGATK